MRFIITGRNMVVTDGLREAVEEKLVVGRCNHRQAYNAASHLLSELIAVAVNYIEFNSGVFRSETGDPPCCHGRSVSLNKPQGNRSGDSAVHCPDFGLGLFRKANHLLGSSVEELSRFRKLKGSLAPDKELRVQLLLKLSYLSAERRLAYVENGGCLCNIQLLRHRCEVFQCSEFH